MFSALLGATLQSPDRKIWDKFASAGLQTGQFLACVWALRRTEREAFPKPKRKLKHFANMLAALVLLTLSGLTTLTLVTTGLNAVIARIQH